MGADVGVLPHLVAATGGREPQLGEARQGLLSELLEPVRPLRREASLEGLEVRQIVVAGGKGLGHLRSATVLSAISPPSGRPP